MKKSILILILSFLTINSFAQSRDYVVEFKKGQVFDVLPLKSNEYADSNKVRKYLNTEVLPRAIELGYIPILSIPIEKGGTTQGNYSPDNIIFGGWKSELALNKIMLQLENEFPDFHSLRREIWTVFYNTHYVLKKDISFKFSPNKLYVATSYWKDSKIGFEAFLEETALNIKEKNGTLILELKDGESPYGYYYSPDYFYITEWDSENDFVEFMEKNELLEKSSLKHINQFKLDTNN